MGEQLHCTHYCHYRRSGEEGEAREKYMHDANVNIKILHGTKIAGLPAPGTTVQVGEVEEKT